MDAYESIMFYLLLSFKATSNNTFLYTVLLKYSKLKNMCKHVGQFFFNCIIHTYIYLELKCGYTEFLRLSDYKKSFRSLYFE